MKTGKVEHETVHGLTSVPPDQATSQVVLALVRGHWSIESTPPRSRRLLRRRPLPGRTGHLAAPSPASPTWPSPSFASRGASTPSLTGTTPGGPKTPCASSSTRRNPHPRATANPRRLDPPPRQRALGRAIHSAALLCIPLQTTEISSPCPPEPPIPPATACRSPSGLVTDPRRFRPASRRARSEKIARILPILRDCRPGLRDWRKRMVVWIPATRWVGIS